MSEFVEFVSSSSNLPVANETIAAAAQCLDRFTAAFNARDLASMDAELHFPHVMLSGAECLVWESPGRNPANLFSTLEGMGWAYTQYEEKVPILASADKVHFMVRYTRRDQQGSVLSEHRNLWVVVRRGEKWGIALRSY